jgi:Na+/H+ antiporter NhaC
VSSGLAAILLILGVIAGAIVTRHCIACLLAGSLFGAVYLYGAQFLPRWCEILEKETADNAWLILVCGIFGSLIGLLRASGGTFGFSRLASKFCTDERRTLLSTFLLGILIFVDDYLNVITIGVCMKNVYDRNKLPRESLAYLLDATGAPVCVLLPFSTWAVFYASLFADQESVMNLGFRSGLDAYIHAIPFCFYPILTLVIVLLFCLGIMPKLGTMKSAYERVRTTGELYSARSKSCNQNQEDEVKNGSLLHFLLPLGVLVGLSVWSGNLLLAAAATLFLCFLLFVPRRVLSADEFLDAVVKGFGDMLPVLIMLLAAFVLQNVTRQMGMIEWIIAAARPYLSVKIFPAMTFILMAALTFTTGSQWGMSAVACPVILPLAGSVGANMILVMAAIISGGAFGSHACFYTDATVLSSQSAGIDNMEHALSQFPYVLIACGISIVLYGLAGVMV